ncbi:hypothetical protein [Mobilicoccus pelagius]|uniref:Putative major facilitator superfamily transporter n=1 Tax=Mobilicoccus pelagius NBRC 104925 TaxID=1089455 RepID=H5USB7_9MICO|nr:hypothetical protein [Mobilicoccus pelagius]GAB48625.1 putative major facilitator superfamily transporter [Mobilicoccus pelagius NBRC 104925]
MFAAVQGVFAAVQGVFAAVQGVFAAVQGVFALVGGATAGFLLDRSVPTLVALVALSQVVAAALLLRTMSARARR